IGSPGVDGPPVMPEDPYAYVVAAFQAPPSPDYVPGPEYPPSPEFVLELVYPEFMPAEDDILPVEEQPLPAAASPTLSHQGRSGDVSPGVDGPSVMPKDPYAYVVTAFQALPPPDYVPGPEEPEQAPPSPVYIPYVPEPVYPEYIPPEDDVFPAEEQPLPAAASPTAESPGYIPESDPKEDDDGDPEEDPADYPADHDDDEEEEHPASADSITPPPALPSPPILPIPLPAALPPLQLLSSDRRADRPEVTLPPRKRLSIVHCPRYKVGESSVAAAARPIESRRADYGFVDSVEAEIRRWRAEDIRYEAEIRRWRAEDIRYGIRDTWIDLRDVAEEEALTTLEGVNTRVTELAAVQEQDTQDIYGVMEDTQGRQTEIFQRVEALVDIVSTITRLADWLIRRLDVLERLGRIL
nr:hypothetical protein [Tanacetum cinerariifolium]